MATHPDLEFQTSGGASLSPVPSLLGHELTREHGGAYPSKPQTLVRNTFLKEMKQGWTIVNI